MNKTILINIIIGLSILIIMACAQTPVVEASRLVTKSEEIREVGSTSISSGLVLASCKVTFVGPKVKLSKGADFEAFWLVRNTADLKWDVNDVDYKYISGKRMNRTGIYKYRYNLPLTVQPGGYVKIKIAMTAPLKKGTYSSKWEIVLGNKNLCALPLKISVK